MRILPLQSAPDSVLDLPSDLLLPTVVVDAAIVLSGPQQPIFDLVVEVLVVGAEPSPLGCGCEEHHGPVVADGSLGDAGALGAEHAPRGALVHLSACGCCHFIYPWIGAQADTWNVSPAPIVVSL